MQGGRKLGGKGSRRGDDDEDEDKDEDEDEDEDEDDDDDVLACSSMGGEALMVQVHDPAPRSFSRWGFFCHGCSTTAFRLVWN